MTIENPYSREYGADLSAPARRIFAITPSDSEPLPQVCKKIRVYNPLDVVVMASIVTVGKDILRLPFAPGVTVEETIVRAILISGTDPNLIFHGYTDVGDPVQEFIDDGRPITVDFSSSNQSHFLGVLL